MMGHTRQRESKLFYTSFSLEQRVGRDNRYRRLNDVLDFSFLRSMVAKYYGQKGHQSEDPIVIMKLMLILFLDGKAVEHYRGFTPAAELSRRLGKHVQ